MEFEISKSEFTKGLRFAQNIADRKSTMAMLANALLRTLGEKKLLVAATDLNVSVSAELDCEVKAKGSLTLGAKALTDIVSSMPGSAMVVKKRDNHWAAIQAGKVKYQLVGMPDRDFPKIPEPPEVEFTEMEASTLREMIDKTLFSVCSDETRFHLNGVLFESNGSTLRMVSTDGHRLSKVERNTAKAPKLSTGVIIPKKGLVEIKRVLETTSDHCQIAVTPPYIFVNAGPLSLAVKLIESQFPPYEQVIPSGHDKHVVIDKASLIDSLKRAALMSSETRGVKLSATRGSVEIAGDNPDLGEIREEIDVDYSGDDVSIGFNPKYVIEFLTQIGADQVTIDLSGELDPVLLRPVVDKIASDDYLGVIMPMRI